MTLSHCPVRILVSSAVALTLGLLLTSSCVLLLTPLTSAVTPDPHIYHDYCIIGAGPAGLQMGYFLGKGNRDYAIFERSNMTGE